MPRSITFAFAIGLAALIVLAGSSALSFEISSWNRVKPGVTVLDVSVGGLSLDEAQAKTSFWNAFKPLGSWWAELPPY